VRMRQIQQRSHRKLPPPSHLEQFTFQHSPHIPHKRLMKLRKYVAWEDSVFAFPYLVTSDLLIFFELLPTLSVAALHFFHFICLLFFFRQTFCSVFQAKFLTPETFSCVVCLPQKFMTMRSLLLCYCDHCFLAVALLSGARGEAGGSRSESPT
jgi:hypothetical protein